MTVVSCDQLSNDMQSFATELGEIGFIPQAAGQAPDANDLLLYISETSEPMANFLQEHGLFMDDKGLHFDLTQFDALGTVAKKVISEYEAGNLDGVWNQFDLSGEEDVSYDGRYILIMLAALEVMYGSQH